MIFLSGREMVKEHKAGTRYHKPVFPYAVNTSYQTVNVCTCCDFRLPSSRKWQLRFYDILRNI